MDTYISQVVLEGGKKRPHDDIEPGAVAEPAWKRHALPTGLPARYPNAEITGDVEMEESLNNGVSTGKELGCLLQQTLPESSEGANEAGSHEPFSIRYMKPHGSVYEFVMKHLTPRSDGSYVYASTWPPKFGTTTSDSPKFPFRDMRLEPSTTFFHINEMILAKKLPFTDGAVYELFARVVNFGCADFPPHYQYFQLEDLFGGMPHLSGVLMRYKSGVDWYKQKGCSVECEATHFAVATEAEGKCYCLCEPVPDSSSELGWSIYIREIQLVTWETIRSVHAHLRK
ncbi:hypothetical protein TGAM01_v202438 [Trichoderma gamsii]|uniref:Uncharacterized protein n=1 Tax=Trichoderma gamsii TaxID=398673 RepID=A0A2P4ZWE4_9HYPO|nr:hypothetical protein TGAM01_v202438 [Trichoderma gamsii]PON28591.1 hypothetical protein TGAM01_v202438 [Trichoderma gamsii]